MSRLINVSNKDLQKQNNKKLDHVDSSWKKPFIFFSSHFTTWSWVISLLKDSMNDVKLSKLNNSVLVDLSFKFNWLYMAQCIL